MFRVTQLGGVMFPLTPSVEILQEALSGQPLVQRQAITVVRNGRSIAMSIDADGVIHPHRRRRQARQTGDPALWYQAPRRSEPTVLPPVTIWEWLSRRAIKRRRTSRG